MQEKKKAKKRSLPRRHPVASLLFVEKPREAKVKI